MALGTTRRHPAWLSRTSAAVGASHHRPSAVADNKGISTAGGTPLPSMSSGAARRGAHRRCEPLLPAARARFAVRQGWAPGATPPRPGWASCALQRTWRPSPPRAWWGRSLSVVRSGRGLRLLGRRLPAELPGEAAGEQTGIGVCCKSTFWMFQRLRRNVESVSF
jgi:hypothetical protein